MQTEFNIPNFEDWMVSSSRVIPVYFSTDAYDLDELHENQVSFPGLKKYSLSTDFDYWFKKINKGYSLKIKASGQLREIVDSSLLLGAHLPLFINVDIYIINERIYDTHVSGG